MSSHQFTATLLRASANGLAAMAASQVVERLGEQATLTVPFDAWQGRFRTLILELAAALEDGNEGLFAAEVVWARDALTARGSDPDLLHAGMEELGRVLEEALPGEAWAPVPRFLAAGVVALEAVGDPEPASPPNPALDDIARHYLALLREGDGARAIDLVLEAVRDGRLSTHDALDGVLVRVLREIGRLWHAAQANVAEEHFVTQTTGRLIELLVFSAPRAEPVRRTVLLTMVEGDDHYLGLRIVAGFFELDGWATVCLGASTPAEDVGRLVERLDVDLVLFGATLGTHRAAAAEAIQVLRKQSPERKILIGGPAFAGLEERAEQLGADACVLMPRDAVQVARKLLDVG